MKVSIIVVTYNTKELIEKLLGNLFRVKGNLNFEIIFVDNNSQDGTREYLKDLNESDNNIHVIFNNENQGFSKAVNQGINVCRNRMFPSSHILLLNSDAMINQAQIEALLNIIELREKIGIVAPQLVNVDGSTQPSFGNFPDIFTSIIYLLRLDKILPLGAVIYSATRKKALFPDWASGACMLIKREVLDKIGALDENYFFGIEDIDFCYRLRQAGYRVVYYPEVRVFHHHQYSSKKFNKKNLVIKNSNDGLKYFYKKFYRPGFLVYAVFSSLVDLGMFLQNLKINIELNNKILEKKKIYVSKNYSTNK